MSGGEKIKLALLKILYNKPDLLVLDEPTNNMDREGVRWLTKLIKSYEGGVVLVSHDQELLDGVVNKVVHLEQVKGRKLGVTHVFCGSIKDYLIEYNDDFISKLNKYRRNFRKKKVALEKANDIKNRVRQQQENIKDCNTRRLLNKKMKNILAVEKNIVKKYEMSKPEREQISGFCLKNKGPKKKNWELEIGALGFPGKNILKKSKINIEFGEKIFITGRNGCGKTTWLDALAVKLEKKGIKYGYFRQEYSNSVNAQTKIVDLFDPGLKERFGWLGMNNLSDWELNSRWGQLSEGQKAIVWLIKLFVEDNEILLLDEPSRNLSIFSKLKFDEILKRDGRAMVVVSHDGISINSVADRLYRIESCVLTEDNKNCPK